MRHRLRLAMLAGLVVLAGCGGEAPEPAPGAETVVLRVEQLPGMPMPSEQVAVPQYTLYGDGRALVVDGYDAALPRILESRVSDSEMAETFDAAAEAGVFEDHDFDTDAVDAGELRITARSTDETSVIAVPGGSDDAEDLTAFADELVESSARSGERYRAKQLGVFFVPAVGSSAAMRWPLPVPEEAAQLPCITVDGEALQRALALARSSERATVWRHDGERFAVVFRPVLPAEADCAAARRSS